MSRSKAWLIVFLLPSALLGADFSGARALEFTRQAVGFGPRPPGSAAIEKLRRFVEGQLRRDGCAIERDGFTAKTPQGPVPMVNLIAKFPGRSGKVTAVTGHYDTKDMPDFVGANDGGSSTGFLLELARVLSSMPHRDDIYLVFFDGEEAFGQWSETDSLHGSRHLAERWSKDGTLARMRALINVDMIGDKDLGVLQEMNSSESLRNLAWKTAREMGYGKYFLDSGFATDDDHMPFVNRGVMALDLIDFDYGPGNQYWHQPADTVDKLSAHSFEVVGRVVVRVIQELELAY